MTEIYVTYVAGPLLVGFVLDIMLGDPKWLKHPVVMIGKIIDLLQRYLLKKGRHEYLSGVLAFFVTVVLSTALPVIILAAATVVDSLLFKYTGLKHFLAPISASLMCWMMVAARSLQKESMKVCISLEAGNTEEARQNVSMIVGRDTSVLDEAGINRAAVETVAENTSDGVTAPLFYMALAGVPGMYLYKAVNTMDSMIGYKNEKYMLYGRFAARADDVMNFIPARITAVLMIAAAYILPGFDGRFACRIYLRDRKKHASPNSGHPESVCAGALNLRLAGPAVYFGQIVEKEYLGDDIRPAEPADIRRACRLMYATSVLMVALMLSAAAAVIIITG